MPLEDPASTTRIYVSGLPPAISSKGLRKHFGQKYTVTDAHVFPDRRIAFVGFADPTDAQHAVKYFHRSFIRMSKISVELARPPDLRNEIRGQVFPIPKHQASSTQDAQIGQTQKTALKRKRDSKDEGEDLRDGSGSEARGEELQLKQSIPDGHQDVVGERQEARNESDYGKASAESPKETESRFTSDADWLRAKTNRILGLQNPQEDISSIRRVHPESIVTDQHTNQENEQSGHGQSPESMPRVSNGRLFIRNLAFDANEGDLQSLFSAYGKLSEVHVVKDKRSLKSRGLGFCEFIDPEHARAAITALDGQPFQGRLLHVLPASDKHSHKLSDFEISKLPPKKQKAIKRKTEAASAAFSWNSLYMNPDAVLASTANRLGVSKADLLDASSTDAAVKHAHAETSIIQDTKDYLSSNGINIEAFKNRTRDERALLLKNFPFGTTAEELSALLEPHGRLEKLILPPTGTMGIALFQQAHESQAALQALAYRNVRGSVLYLERAPDGLFTWPANPNQQELPVGPKLDSSTGERESNLSSSVPATLFVRNLNFATSSARLQEVFKALSGYLSARVKTKTDPGRPGQILSTGFGFVEFRTKAQAEAAVTTLNGHSLDGHQLSVQMSQKSVDAAEQQRTEEKLKKNDQAKTKIIIKNLPFEASKKDVRSLFGAYGKLRSVRMPKKFDHSARGFAFADFVSAKEAKNAIEALSNTHLLGRRLVLDFAEGEAEDPEDVIKAMEKKAGRQVHLTAVDKMINGSVRKKFAVDAGGGGEY